MWWSHFKSRHHWKHVTASVKFAVQIVSQSYWGIFLVLRLWNENGIYSQQNVPFCFKIGYTLMIHRYLSQITHFFHQFLFIWLELTWDDIPHTFDWKTDNFKRWCWIVFFFKSNFHINKPCHCYCGSSTNIICFNWFRLLTVLKWTYSLTNEKANQCNGSKI